MVGLDTFLIQLFRVPFLLAKGRGKAVGKEALLLQTNHFILTEHLPVCQVLWLPQGTKQVPALLEFWEPNKALAGSWRTFLTGVHACSEVPSPLNLFHRKNLAGWGVGGKKPTSAESRALQECRSNHPALEGCGGNPPLSGGEKSTSFSSKWLSLVGPPCLLICPCANIYLPLVC